MKNNKTIYAEDILKKIEKWLKSIAMSRQIKKIIGYSFVVAILVSAGVFWFMFRDAAETAAWWDEGWHYRKAITVTNSTGADLTDFQVKILDGEDLSGDIIAGKIQADLDDIRFTDINGDLLNYWIEDTTATTSINAWIKVPAVYNGTDATTVYFYYGNQSAIDAQDGEQVFEFFDDFDDNSVNTDKWTIYGDTWQETGGYLGVPDSGSAGRTFSWAVTADYTVTDAVIETEMTPYDVGSSQGKGVVFRFTDTNNSYIATAEAWSSGYIDIGKRVSGDWTNLTKDSMTGGITASVAYKQIIKFSETSFSNKTINLSTDQTTTTTSSGDSAHTGSKPVGLIVDRDETSTGAKFNYIFVRQYASTDPVVASPSSEEKGTGPVAYWSFDEGYGITAYDETSNGNDGTISGATWKSESECVVGKCLYFDGSNTDNNNTVTVPVGSTNPELGILSDVTVSAWIKPSSSYSDTNQAVLRNGQGTDLDYSIFYDSTNQRPSFQWYDGSWGTVYGTSGSIPLDTWSFINIVRSGTTVNFYVNGVFINSETVTSPTVVSSQLAIGRTNNVDVPQDYSGFIDEPKIYDYARTADQIKQDYNAGLSGVKSSSGTSASIGSKSQNWMSDGLVGYWKMDEATWDGTSGEVIDASGNGNNGTAVGTASTTAGKFGNGGVFDGDSDYVNAGNSSDLNFTTNGTFSISLWIKPDTLTSAWRRGIIVEESYLNSGFRFGFDNGGKPRFWTAQSGGTLAGPVSSTAMTINEWNHVVVTYDNQQAYIYLNGTQTGSATGTYVAGTNNFYIGKAVSEYFDGSLDEVRVYNRALSGQEVVALYNWAPGPVGHWKMDEKSGTTVYDTSGNGNNGTMTNMDANTDWVQGKYGSALSFDGSDDYVSVAHNSIYNFGTGGFTVMGWVYTKGEPSLYGAALIDKGSGDFTDSSSNQKGFWLSTARNRNPVRNIKWAVGNGSGYNSITYSFSNELLINQWHHIVGVADDQAMASPKLRLYIDGILVDSVDRTFLGPIDATSSYINIGRSGALTRYLNANIDDVKIYNYARTPKQIVEDMNAGHPAGGSPVGSQIGYWKFDKGYGMTAYDSSPQGNDGTISGATWTNDGKFGKALSFDGSDDYVNIGNIIPTLTEGSVSVWFKRMSGNETYQMILTDSGSQLEICYSGDNLRFYVDNSAVNTSLANNNGVWQHVVGVFSQSRNYKKIYLNGKEVSSAVYTDDATAATRYIGSRAGEFPFNGQIDEVKIYNYALTEDEVKLDYNQGKSLILGSPGVNSDGTASSSASVVYCVPGDTSTCRPPVAEWKFDEKTGDTVYDTSGNGNDGTLTNSPTWTRGKKGSALDFDGDDDYVIKDSPSFIPTETTALTLSVWIKPDSTQNTAQVGIVGWDGGTGATGGRRMICLRNTGEIYFWGSSADFNPTLTWEADVWQNITLTITDNKLVSIYKNGLFIDSTIVSDLVDVPSDNSIYLGVRETFSQYFNGQIDDVKIYDYARTPAQVAWDYNHGAPVGWWKFDEGEGTTAHDYTDNLNHGTLTNMANDDWVAGKINTALDFDGSDDYVDGGDVFDAENSLSIAFWLYPEIWADGKSRGIISKKTNDSANGYVIYNDGTYPNKINFRMKGLDGSSSYLASNLDVEINTWQHWVVTYDSLAQTAKWYKNGNLDVVYTSISIGDMNNDEVLQFGHSQTWNGFFDGFIDDVRLYNYALTEAQIKMIYNDGAVNFR